MADPLAAITKKVRVVLILTVINLLLACGLVWLTFVR
jgi:hypothetical protein